MIAVDVAAVAHVGGRGRWRDLRLRSPSTWGADTVTPKAAAVCSVSRMCR